MRQLVAQQWPAEKAGRFAVEAGFSGGVDSVVLLHILCSLRNELPLELSAVHVHHGLDAAADEWAAFCRELCGQWQVPLRVERVRVEFGGLGLEAAARAERYRCFARSRADAVALAHHADDQAETLLLAALRGGGLRALAAMPALRALNERVSLWRPLLAVSRAELVEYARAHRLPWVEDDSNADTTLLRNWLRRHGLPPWQERMPKLQSQLLSSVSQLQRDLALLDDYTESEHRSLYDAAGRFQVASWRQLSPLRQAHQLHVFARRHHLGSPFAAGVRQFADTLANPAVLQAEWPLPRGRAVLYAGRLFAVPNAQANGQPFAQPAWQPAPHGLPENLIRPASGIWRTPEPGDTLPLPHGRKKISRLLQEKKVPPFMRALWPLWANEQHGCLAAANLQTHCKLSVPNGWQARAEELEPFILAGSAHGSEGEEAT
ncbi:tRNA lysidine(34) synthetase TilS [Eikenella sp. Marseille-P7795]|uniref:tRNA lysidine(34) synthetase TilS n=1 Tax=Eikenella sp. Marseille-P7795 TaxID=2866577 RepID=UPI001CE42C04|nr:tRNA lysidine(34) synthetase TilS [Eikenella sp. Marseille-P7795]